MSPVAPKVKNLPTMQETQVWSIGWQNPLKGSMATHSSYSCLEYPTDKGAWWAIVHGVRKESNTTERLTLSLFKQEGNSQESIILGRANTMRNPYGQKRAPSIWLRGWHGTSTLNEGKIGASGVVKEGRGKWFLKKGALSILDEFRICSRRNGKLQESFQEESGKIKDAICILNPLSVCSDKNK